MGLQWYLSPTSPLLLGNTRRQESGAPCVVASARRSGYGGRGDKKGEFGGVASALYSRKVKGKTAFGWSEPPATVQGRGRQEGFGVLDKRGRTYHS